MMANSAKYHGRRSTRAMKMKNSLQLAVAIIAAAAVLSPWVADSFAPPPSRRLSTVGITSSSSSSSSSAASSSPHHVINVDTTPAMTSSQQPTLLLAALNDESSFSSNLDFVSNDDAAAAAAAAADALPTRTTNTRRRLKFLSAIRHKTKPITLAILTAVSTTFFLPRGGGNHPFAIQPAKASAPIVLRAAQKKDDPPMIQALKKAEELKKQRSLEEFDAFMAQANDIELSQGKSARAEYEKQYQLQKSQREAQTSREILLLKRQLLDAGQDPHTDLNAERQIFLLEHNVDLEKISGTPQNERMIKNFQKRRGKKSGDGTTATDEELKYQRYIIACQVADLKARGVDPMEYFANVDNMQKTRSIYKMEDGVAERVAKQYESLMKEYGGRLTPKKEGEVPFVYPEIVVDGDGAASAGGSGSSGKEDKAAAKAKRLAEKEALRQERADAKAKAKEERMVASANAKAERVAAKEQKLAEKAAAKAAAAAAAAGSMVAVSAVEAVSSSAISVAKDAVLDAETVQSKSVAVTSDTRPTKSATTTDAVKSALSTIQSKATIKNIGTIVVGGGVATYAYNYFQENNAGAQKERERQLKLILGQDDDDDEDDDEFDDDDDEDDDFSQLKKNKVEPKQQQPPPPPKQSLDEAPKATKPAPTAVPTPSSLPPPPKKKLGIFSKRNADARETDLNKLIGPNSQAPEFAKLLAQILTFGAPGRFPKVTSWSTPMPLNKFDLDTAKSLITQSRDDAGLTDTESAELFASVVNCMVIDIVDLASSTLKGKEKNEKVAVDAINVVMDFMDHAASLFDAVAKDVTIKPVTYGGNLRKKDLEQMFSVYAGSSMLSLDGTGSAQDRVDTLQLVFAISDKKAEGLMQKHMMKMMMNLMKDGGKGLEGMPGMEGMEEMMKAMGGGMPGMPGMDGEVSPEDLKQTLGMMKEMMDSGQVSQEELVEVRKQFKEMYGNDISDLIKKASEDGAAEGMSADERELLDVFKQLLGDD